MDPEPTSSRPAARCCRCAATFDGDAWRALALAERIDASAIVHFVSNWPSDRCVEVRRCRCGHTIAMRVAA